MQEIDLSVITHKLSVKPPTNPSNKNKGVLLQNANPSNKNKGVLLQNAKRQLRRSSLKKVSKLLHAKANVVLIKKTNGK